VAAKSKLVANTIWSRRSRRQLADALKIVRPDLVHVHNTFAMLSPSVYGACRRERRDQMVLATSFDFAATDDSSISSLHRKNVATSTP
jgi:hypothetical protein